MYPQLLNLIEGYSLEEIGIKTIMSIVTVFLLIFIWVRFTFLSKIFR